MGLDAVGINIIILEDPLVLLALIDGVGISIKFVILSLARERRGATRNWIQLKQSNIGGNNYINKVLSDKQ